MSTLKFWKQFFMPVRLYGGGGDTTGETLSGQASLQMAGISQQQWDWYQSQYLPQATTAMNASNAQAAAQQQAYTGAGGILDQANADQENLTSQSATSVANQNAIAGADMANQQSATQNASADMANQATATGNAATDQTQANINNAASNVYGIGNLGSMNQQADYYTSAAGQQAQAMLAAGDTTSAFNAQNQQAIQSAQQRGIAPNSGLMQGVQNQNGISEAAAQAYAQTQARQAAMNLGWNYKQQVEQDAAAYGSQGTAQANAATSALNSAATSSDSAATQLNAATTAGSGADTASSSAVSSAAAPGTGLSTLESAQAGAQAAAGLPLGNLNAVSNGLNGGAQSATSAGSAAGQTAGALANSQSQTAAGNAAGTGEAVGGGLAAAGAVAAAVIA